MRHSCIVNEQVMQEVKDSVSNEGSDNYPRIVLEPEDSKKQESSRDHALYNECPPGSSHRGKQHIVGRDHDQHRRIENALAVKADNACEKNHRHTQHQADQEFQIRLSSMRAQVTILSDRRAVNCSSILTRSVRSS